jgi:GT2 family glycosyltransferase
MLELLYLVTAGAEGRGPHPLFDCAYYLRNNPEVAASGVDPLVHYRDIGSKELRNPHALFDSKFYAAHYPEVLAAKADPLVHFLIEGAQLGYNPNPYFDTGFYLWRNPEVKSSGMNPLVHFVRQGARRGLDPHPLFGMNDYAARYPDIGAAGTNQLSHYLEFGRFENRTFARPLCFAERLSGDPEPMVSALRRKGHTIDPAPVFCVYGPSNVEFLRDAVLPAFANELTEFPIELHFVNYRAPEALLKSFSVQDWSETRSPGHWGFGQSINYLFEMAHPVDYFVLCNPDSFPMQGCLARLVDTYYLAHDAAIVEARQWPTAHPKEFNADTLETPWASGAFSLISSTAFAALGGFDPVYFLYMEDVDLSWRAWLKGFRVLHQPLALCAHETGLHSYQTTRFYHEHFFSLRNFLVISYKFFEELGERVALEYLRAANLPKQFYRAIIASYFALKPSIAIQPAQGSNADKIKILGLNIFHEYRR